MLQGAPIVAFVGSALMLAVVVLALRWTWGTGRGQVAPRVVDPNDPTGDGLLTEVSRVPTQAAAQVLRSRLGAAGIRATVGRASDGGFRLLVFATDLPNARVVLSRGALG